MLQLDWFQNILTIYRKLSIETVIIKVLDELGVKYFWNLKNAFNENNNDIA